MDRIFVAGSKTFDITQFRNIADVLKMNMGIQSELTLGGYDWVIQFYPNGTSTQLSTDPAFYLKVLNATEECSAICSVHRWNWTTSKWDIVKTTPMMALQPSGDKVRFCFLQADMQYFEDPNYLKDDMIIMKFDLLVRPRSPAPAPAPPLQPDVDNLAGTNKQGNPSGAHNSFHNGFHTADYAPPNAPNNTKLPRQPTVRIYCQANDELSVTARNGTVVLAPTNPNDHYQHWIKDMSYGDKAKDASGLPAFALVNRVTGEALKNPAGENQEVTLVPYNRNLLEDSVKWTEVEGSTGFRAIRIADTNSLNLTAVGFNSNFSDGSKIVVQKPVNAAVQRWKIVFYN